MRIVITLFALLLAGCGYHTPGASDNWVGGEDGFFAFHMEMLGGKVADADWCEKFAAQKRFRENSWGVHKPENLKGAELEAFLAYCPEARILL